MVEIRGRKLQVLSKQSHTNGMGTTSIDKSLETAAKNTTVR